MNDIFSTVLNNTTNYNLGFATIQSNWKPFWVARLFEAGFLWFSGQLLPYQIVHGWEQVDIWLGIRNNAATERMVCVWAYDTRSQFGHLVGSSSVLLSFRIKATKKLVEKEDDSFVNYVAIV